MTDVMSAAPRSDADLFSDEILLQPYETYRMLRSMGPVVALQRCDALGVTTFAAVRQVLRDWRTFPSGQGVGLNDAVNSMGRESVLMSDPPRHEVLRGVLMDRLAPRALEPVGERIRRQAFDLVDRLLEAGTVDAVRDLARVFPVQVVGDLIGLPPEGREDLLRLADGTFNSFGPDNERARLGMTAWAEQAQVLRRIATRDRLCEGSLGMAVYEAADAGVIDAADTMVMLGTYLNAGMDTTINAISAMMMLFARHPEQWELLRREPERRDAAFEEVLRYESPVQTFTRLAAKPVAVGGTEVAAGRRVVVLFGSANRDEQRWEHADTFDIARPARAHVGFGFGIHSCAGQALARIEARAILDALLAQVRSWEIGTPIWHLNNVIRGLESLPLTFEPL
ncbi:cytochrome P450 [Spirillospora sp. CA-255316]